MNWDTIEGNWKQLRGKAQEKWGELTDSEYDQIGGKKDQLVGKLQEKYGITRDEAERRADEFGAANQGHPVSPVTGAPDTRGVIEKIADAVTGDKVDDKTGRRVD
ncbi:CsbD family protein [bacterium]|nr:MAG: CsbD family protein [bacterium]